MTGHPELSQLRPQPPQAQHRSSDGGIILRYVLPGVVTQRWHTLGAFWVSKAASLPLKGRPQCQEVR